MQDKPTDSNRVIKRYANRKLYDARTRHYVTLDEIGHLVSSGEELSIVDQKTGDDLTNVTLAQVLLEGLKQRTSRIPRPVLVRLVRLGYSDTHLPDWSPQHAAEKARHEAERIASGLIARGRLSIEEALALRHEIAGTMQSLVAEAQRSLEQRVHGLLDHAPEPLGAAISALKERLFSLETPLEAPPAPEPAHTPSAAPRRRKARSSRSSTRTSKE